MGFRRDVLSGEGAEKTARTGRLCRHVRLLLALGLFAGLAVHGTLTDLEDVRDVLNAWQWLLLPQERRVWEDVGDWGCAPYGELAALVFGGSASNRVSIYAYEDADTRETVLADAGGTPLAALPPLVGYSPFWVCGIAGRYTDLPGDTDLLGDFDPSRVGVRIGLVAAGTGNLKSSASTTGYRAVSAESVAERSSTAVMMSGCGAVTAVAADVSVDAVGAEASAAVRTALPTNPATAAFVPALEGVRVRSTAVLRPASTSASVLSSVASDGAVETDETVVTHSQIRADVVQTRTVSSLPLSPAGLELHYDFATDAGNGKVIDTSWNGRDGASSGCVWTNAGCFAGGAFAFSGNNSSVNVGMDVNFPRWSEYTVSVWFLYDGGGDVGPQYGIKMVDRTSMYHDWHLSLHPIGHDQDTGAVSLTLYEGNASRSLVDGTRNWGDGLWHHAVVVRRGTRGELWMDGTLRAEMENMIDVYSESALCVGNSYSTDYYQRKGWSGLLDEVAIFGRALSTNEIVHLHAEGIPAGAESHIAFATNVVFQGGVSFAEDVVFGAGVRLLCPQGDLSFGNYTNGVPGHAE